MSVVNLSNLALFNKQQTARLNQLVAVNRQLMPHVVAAAIGCRLEEAMALLIFLYDKNLSNGFTLVYHSKHQDFYFARHPLKNGLPKANDTFCQICEEYIEDDFELLYDFEFVVNKDVTFEMV
ncbi:MAG: hypothetical protein HY869_22060 [Chloroflexi bacterium]|nr:hypothetical protein [Chloroflexota bacterium]